MRTGQIIQLIVIALVFVIPALIRVIKGAQDAAARRRMEQMRQRAQEDALRTGRPIEQATFAPPPTAPMPMQPTQAQQSAQDRLRELAARRQAQIDALRRARAQGSAGPVAPPTAYQRPPSTGGYAPLPQARPAARPQRPQQQSRANARQQPVRQQRPSPPQPPPPRVESDFPPPTGEIGGPPHDHEGEVTHRLVADVPPPPPLHPVLKPGSGKTGALGIAEIRKAIVLREVLGKPPGFQDRPGE